VEGRGVEGRPSRAPATLGCETRCLQDARSARRRLSTELVRKRHDEMNAAGGREGRPSTGVRETRGDVAIEIASAIQQT